MGYLKGQTELSDDQSVSEVVSLSMFPSSNIILSISEIPLPASEGTCLTPETSCATPETTCLTPSLHLMNPPPLQLPQTSISMPTSVSADQLHLSENFELESNNQQNTNNFPFSQADIRDYYTLLSQASTDEIISRYQASVKSNSIKTILYHFIKFMKYTGDDIIIEALSSSYDKPISHIRKEFQSFIKQKSLNQQTFIALFHSLRFRSHLEYYLKYYSLDTIIGNSVKDPLIHVLCLVFFQKCFNDKSLLESIKTYKKKI